MLREIHRSCLFLLCLMQTGYCKVNVDSQSQVWDYVKVRSDAYMFWWLYYTNAGKTYTDVPLVMWLQGGPGGSSTGFGNFQEIGPLDVQLRTRNTTWLKDVNLLFVDNPVGTGYSYVTNDSAYARNSHDIAVDLVTTIKTFLRKLPPFQNVPFYIFSESYGGKMTAAFAQELYYAIQDKQLICNFQGFAMGDSWISPVDSVVTWAPYLYSTSLIDGARMATIDKTARACQKAVYHGNWSIATELWSELEDIVEEVTYGVNWYNILKWGDQETTEKRSKALISMGHIERQYERHVSVYQNDVLSDLMNGPIRKKLKIIPNNVTWGGQSGAVFQELRGDFMKDVVHIVSSLLKTPLKIVVYNGQLDLIVDTMGTDEWVHRLDWSGMEEFVKSPRTAWYSDSANSDDGSQTTKDMAGYVKQYKNFSFYWVMKAGHMIPADAGEAALKLLKLVTTA